MYLCSEGGGETWYNEGTRCRDWPLTIERSRAICSEPKGGPRTGNHVVDRQGRTWLFGVTPGGQHGILWRREESGWAAVDLSGARPELDLGGGRSSCLSRDASGRIWLALAADLGGAATAWFDPRHEILCLLLDENGNVLRERQVTQTDPSVAHWLPALEPCDWGGACQAGAGAGRTEGVPWMLYTAGLNAGGIGGDNRNAVRTRVYLGRCEEGL